MKQSTVFPADAKSSPVHKDGLCLLSLDGGGVRGLSSLFILKRIMDEVNRLRKERGLPSCLPCEVFDMIGGTSTGGLIAIMLGRLNMNVDECIEAYKEFMGSIFGSKTHWLPISRAAGLQARYDGKKVKEAVEKLLRKHGHPEDGDFNDGTERKCRVFVCCVATDTLNPVRIRSYNKDFHENIPAKVWEAALATSAATTYFAQVKIGPYQYVDGAFRNNNPVSEVEAEAQDLWCPDQVELKSLVKCFVSIGTGIQAPEELSDNPLYFLGNLKYLATDTEATNRSFQDRWRRNPNDKRSFRFDVERGLEKVKLADHEKQNVIESMTHNYMDNRDPKLKLQACAENLMGKDSQGTPLDFHETVLSFKLHEMLGSHDIKDFHDCRAVLRVTDVEKDRNDLRNRTGARVPGTFEWIHTDALYQDWQSSKSDTLWITAEPARGKTVLALFILEDLEQYISTPTTSPGSIVQEERGKKADLYYFFCSNEVGSRQGAVAVFRSLIYQIVSKHEDLMKYVLDYLSNDRPIHADNQPEYENEKQQSSNQEKKDQRSRLGGIQNSAEQKFSTQTKFVRNLLRSPAGVKEGPDNTTGMQKEVQTDKESGERPKHKPSLFRNMLENPRKEEQSKDEPEQQQETEPESGSTSSADPPERDSPKSRQLELLDVSELSFILTKLIRELPVDTIYFLLDGVNECVEEEQKALTSTLLKMCDVKPGKFKLLVVSQLIGGMGTTPTIKLEENGRITGDIEKYVSKSVEQLAHIDGFSEIQQEVEQALIKGAEGTFLCVSLVMDEMKEMKTCSEILDAIRSVPPGLNNKYKHMLDQIKPAQKSKVHQILNWVTAAVRPLTLQELSKVIEVPRSSPISPEQAVRDVVKSSEGLLAVRGSEVTFIHSTLKTILLSVNISDDGGLERVVDLDKQHFQLAECCYQDILRSRLSRSEMKVSKLSDQYEPKLLKYAIKHWMEHVKASDWAEKNFDPDAEFFRRNSKLRKNWWTAYLEDSQNDDPKHFNVASLTHLAAYFGIVPWITPAFKGKGWIVKKGTTFMDLDHYFRTPLHIAVEQGHGTVVSLLLSQGVDIEFREASLFATPLHLAARNGHKDICKILLDQKASINARNRFYSTPLTEAARGGHLDVVMLLVEQGADINGSINKSKRSLYRQIENVPGYTKRAFGKIDGLEYAERSTPVIEAARQNHADIIRYLVHNDASIEAKTLGGLNALHVAAYHGQLKAVEVLVELGAKIERSDNSTRTALYLASWQNHADVVKWLLDRHAYSDSLTGWDSTPLLVASRNDHVEPMRLLLEARANIEHRNEMGQTSLAVAAVSGSSAAVRLLIARNAKINAQDNSGNIALMHAIQEHPTDELVDLVQLLLKHGADVNHKNRKGLTPLIRTAQLSDQTAAGIVQYLLEAGAVLDARDSEGRTPLMHASKGGSNKTRELLLDNGAALEAKDDLGHTALIIAAGYSSRSAVEFLLDHGADIEACDIFGFTPLIKAARCGLEDTAKLLLDRGAQIAAVDSKDQMAIDHAATIERGNIIKLLKSRGASRHKLTMINHAAARLSNMMYLTAEICREWEREKEIGALKELGKISSDEGSDSASSKEQTLHELSGGDTITASDVDSDRTDVKLMDEGSPQTSADEQTPQVVQGTPDNESSDGGSARTGTDSIEGDSEHAGAEEEIESEAPSPTATTGLHKGDAEITRVNSIHSTDLDEEVAKRAGSGEDRGQLS